jgi:hypothetical protein
MTEIVGRDRFAAQLIYFSNRLFTHPIFRSSFRSLGNQRHVRRIRVAACRAYGQSFKDDISRH